MHEDGTQTPVRPRQRQSAPEQRPDIQWLYGLHSCVCALAGKSRHIHRAYMESTAGGSGTLSLVATALAEARIPVTRTDKMTLHNMCGSALHQGVVLQADNLQIPFLEHELGRDGSLLQPAGPSVVIALDEVMDPHNVGAILRSALLFNVHHVIISLKNSAPLNATVCKTSSGAFDILAAARKLVYAKSMTAALAHYQDAKWIITGTSAPSASNSRADGVTMVPVHEMRADPNRVLIVGNEGKGMRTHLRKMCTELVYIPQHNYQANIAMTDVMSQLPLVDSFNVSVATAVLLQQLFQQQQLLSPPSPLR
jgi:tRNA G18 (ribose-2'-O)-methylase SpoU